MTKKPATLKDIAKATTYDISTISKVLGSGEITVRNETRQKIIEEARRVNYRPNSIARNLKTNITGSLGILLPNLRNPVYASIVCGAIKRATELGYSMLVLDGLAEKGTFQIYKRVVDERRVDGIIIASSVNCDETNAALKAYPFPHIFVNRKTSCGHSVTFDDFEVGRFAATCLINKGHKCLGFIGESDILDTAKRRRAGFASGCSIANIDSLVDVVGPYTKEGGYNSFLNILKKKPQPTAIFASNILVGIGALAAASEREISIPSQISIISLENEYAQYTSPPLTTIDIPLEKMGSRSVDAIKSILDGNKPSNLLISDQPKVIARASLSKVNFIPPDSITEAACRVI